MVSILPFMQTIVCKQLDFTEHKNTISFHLILIYHRYLACPADQHCLFGGCLLLHSATCS